MIQKSRFDIRRCKTNPSRAVAYPVFLPGAALTKVISKWSDYGSGRWVGRSAVSPDPCQQSAVRAHKVTRHRYHVDVVVLQIVSAKLFYADYICSSFTAYLFFVF